MKKLATGIFALALMTGTAFAAGEPVNHPAPVQPTVRHLPVAPSYHPRGVGVMHCDKFLFFPRHCYYGRRWL